MTRRNGRKTFSVVMWQHEISTEPRNLVGAIEMDARILFWCRYRNDPVSICCGMASLAGTTLISHFTMRRGEAPSLSPMRCFDHAPRGPVAHMRQVQSYTRPVRPNRKARVNPFAIVARTLLEISFISDEIFYDATHFLAETRHPGVVVKDQYLRRRSNQNR